MKTILLSIALIATLLQAEDTVHYDKKEIKESGVNKPNHPSSDLYTKK